MVRVLLVEDEALVRMMICEDLTDHGHVVVTACTGDDAVEILQTNVAFDLIVTDIRMPGSVDGWKLGELVRTLIPKVKIIYATGYTDAMPVLGPDERILTKPFVYADVVRLITELTET